MKSSSTEYTLLLYTQKPSAELQVQAYPNSELGFASYPDFLHKVSVVSIRVYGHEEEKKSELLRGGTSVIKWFFFFLNLTWQPLSNNTGVYIYPFLKPVSGPCDHFRVTACGYFVRSQIQQVVNIFCMTICLMTKNSRKYILIHPAPLFECF